MTTMFLSWISHHGRSAALASELGVPAIFITGGSGPAPVRYVRAAAETFSLLRRNDPVSKLILMLPPLPALLAAAWSRRDLRIAGDLHSGVFNDKKWSWALRPTLAILRRRGIAIVTNEALAQVCRNHGVETVVLHDMIEDFGGEAPKPPLDLAEHSYVLFPVAYAADEPIDAILEAASRLPQETFVLTGRAPESARDGAPANVVFTGFVSNPDFEALLRNAGAVAALTTREDTMQRAGYEALSAGVPLVASSTAVLREYFSDAAVYTDASATGIETALTEVRNERSLWTSRLTTLKAQRYREQRMALRSLEVWVNG